MNKRGSLDKLRALEPKGFENKVCTHSRLTCKGCLKCGRQIDIKQKDRQMDRWLDRRTDRQKDRWIDDRQIHTQTERQMDR